MSVTQDNSDMYVVFAKKEVAAAAAVNHQGANASNPSDDKNVSSRRFHSVVESYASTYHLLPSQDDKDLIIGTIFDQLKKEGASFLLQSREKNDVGVAATVVAVNDERRCHEHIKRAILKFKPTPPKPSQQVTKKTKKRRRKPRSTTAQPQAKHTKMTPNLPTICKGSTPTMLNMLQTQVRPTNQLNVSNNYRLNVIPYAAPAEALSSVFTIPLQQYCRGVFTPLEFGRGGGLVFGSAVMNHKNNNNEETNDNTTNNSEQQICDTVLDSLDMALQVEFSTCQEEECDGAHLCCWDPLPLGR